MNPTDAATSTAVFYEYEHPREVDGVVHFKGGKTIADFLKSLPGQKDSRGLGDTVAIVTHATGLDKLSAIYTSITGKPCGCSDRQAALNKLIPYGIKEED